MEKQKNAAGALFLAWFCLLGELCAAAPLQPADVPEPLKPWIDWVVAEDKERACPFLYNNFSNKRCAWPAELRLDLHSDAGTFSADWRVFADTWLVLPGDQIHWPEGVEVNGTRRAVVERQGRPSLHLTPGNYTLTGGFVWSKLPESLVVPPDTGIVVLTVRGELIDFPKINRNGQIWLGRGERASGDAEGKAVNNHSLTVLRRIIDDIPLQIHTRIELDVTGEQRELVLGRPLLDGFIPIAIKSPLPARIDPNGDLRVQLRAGRHVIEVDARHPAPLTELVLRTQPLPWPTSEVWAFDARNDLRLVEIKGVIGVDPGQTRAPDGWHRLPTYTVAAGDTMTFVTIRRGDPDPEPDKFALSRRLWLDFDGRGYTAQDRINGTITRNWRLDSGPDLHLGQVVVDGQPRFITRVGPSHPDGVELRRRRLDLIADARMDRGVDNFAATGWAHDFQNVEATLNLPPGWDVFAIKGVDNVPRTWLARWTLLDLFLVLVLSAAAMRLWDRRAGVATLLMLVLIWHAPDAPRYIWLSLFITVALSRVLPGGRVRWIVNGIRNVTVIALIIICIPFAVHEFRLAVYPQLEVAHQQVVMAPAGSMAGAKMAPESVVSMSEQVGTLSVEAVEAGVAMDDESFATRKESAARSGPAPQPASPGRQRAKRAPRFAVDPAAIIQTGPGLPRWRWKSLQLNWNGPVDQNQRVSITYIPPLASSSIHVLRVVLIGIVLILVFGADGRRLLARTRETLALLLATALISGAFPVSDAVAGNFPDPALLETLRERLNAPPECLNRCADITRMRVDIGPTTLQIRLETHAPEVTAVPLPGHLRQWVPRTVALDGNAAAALARDAHGTLWLQIPAGVHQVYLAGTLPDRRNVQIALPLRPHAVDAVIDGWSVRGMREDGQAEAQLEFTRLGADTKTHEPAAFEANQLPSFIRVERTLRLDLDWTLTTKVARLSPGTTAAVFEVPLVDGESVVTPGIEIADGRVKVNLAAGAQSLVWHSVLAKSEELQLTAPDTTAWLETWVLQGGPMWHLEFDGIAPVHNKASSGQWLPQWRPWPGETVTFKVVKPEGVPGQSLTIDSSSLHIEPGKRATDTTLVLNLRSSKGGQYTLRLPADVKLQAVRINGAPEALRAEGRDLTIPVTPGAQTVDVQWRKAAGIASRFSSDPIDLKIASINHQVEMMLGSDRWTLLTFGPRMGPAVRFWSLFGILLVVAFGLARVPLTPLTTTQWLLLAIGLSQVAVPMAAVVVLWLLALGLRERHGTTLAGFRFNLAQIGLVLLTVAALVVLIEAIRHGLLGHPDMHVAGNGSSAHQLRWYADRVPAQTPGATVLSVPILVYRLVMLTWALWLALAILKWLRWGWGCFATNGLWQPWRRPKEVPA